MSGFLLNPYALGAVGGTLKLQDETILTEGNETTIQYTNSLGYFDVLDGNITVDLTAYGGAGGIGAWNGNSGLGGPGGIAKGRYLLAIGRYYYFIGNGNRLVNGKGGAGGGSTDVRTFYSNSSFSLTSFLQSTSLDSRIIVAGGGGGAHGGSYGAWGNVDSPGAGGPTKADTNSRGTNDNGFLDTGADASQPGLDGGSSMSTSYTASGIYGAGGIVTNQYEVYTESSTYTGMGWPNGGSGNTWANGGGGGGWYGGASNWPNGGGGSNNLKSYGGAILLSSTLNTSNGSTNNGYLIIRRV
jgi:hypothetical protein